MAEELPGGLAAGKVKIFQVNLDDGAYVIFEYYTEYGSDGVASVRCIDPQGNVEGPFYAPVSALIVFADFFRQEGGKAKATS